MVKKIKNKNYLTNFHLKMSEKLNHFSNYKKNKFLILKNIINLKKISKRFILIWINKNINKKNV